MNEELLKQLFTEQIRATLGQNIKDLVVKHTELLMEAYERGVNDAFNLLLNLGEQYGEATGKN